MNAKRLHHDLYWGCRLNMLRIKYSAYGFRGKQKGQGFRAYLMAEKIPIRMAYRLIRRYRLVEQTMRWAQRENIDLQNDLFRPEDLAKFLESFKRMSDIASVTNEENKCERKQVTMAVSQIVGHDSVRGPEGTLPT